MDINLSEFLRSGAMVDLTPTRVAIGWGRCEETSDESAGRLRFWLQPFFANSTSGARLWRIFAHSIEIEKAELHARLASYESETSRTSERVALQWSALNTARYEENFRRAQALIQGGELEKIVLYSTSEAAWQPSRRVSLIRAALSHHHLYPFGFWQDSWGWVGATPEILFEYVAPGTVVLEALAGTVAIEARDQLRRDHKILLEQQLVVDDIKRQVVELGSVEESSLDVYENAPLAHLRRRVTLRARGALSWSELISALHPTAAVGGYPREATAAALRHLHEEIPRLYYGAPIGVSDGRSIGRCLVGLRGVYFSDAAMRCQIWVGGGITADSDLALEWKELQLKLTAVRRWLQV